MYSTSEPVSHQLALVPVTSLFCLVAPPRPPSRRSPSTCHARLYSVISKQVSIRSISSPQTLFLQTGGSGGIHVLHLYSFLAIHLQLDGSLHFHLLIASCFLAITERYCPIHDASSWFYWITVCTSQLLRHFKLCTFLFPGDEMSRSSNTLSGLSTFFFSF